MFYPVETLVNAKNLVTRKGKPVSITKPGKKFIIKVDGYVSLETCDSAQVLWMLSAEGVRENGS